MVKSKDIFIEPEFSSYYQKNPLNLIDIGASGGINENWIPAKKYLHIIGFEPDTGAFNDLQKNNVNSNTYFNIGLSDKESTIDFYLTKKQRCSSIFKPNRDFLDQFSEPERFDIVDTIKFKSNTLNNVLNGSKIVNVDFIKVDTQGSELLILEGGSEILDKSIFGLEIEVSFTEMYQNQALFADIDIFMRQHDFQLFDLRLSYFKRTVGEPFGKPKGQLVYGDALYFKSMHGLNKILNHLEDAPAKKSKLIKILSICFLYGYYDYAYQILTSFRDLFEPNESKVIEIKIKNHIHIRRRIPYFPGRKKLSDLFYKLWDIFEPKPTRSSSGMSSIGNT